MFHIIDMSRSDVMSQSFAKKIRNTKGLHEYIGEADSPTDVLKFVLHQNDISSFYDIISAKEIVEQLWDEYWRWKYIW